MTKALSFFKGQIVEIGLLWLWGKALLVLGGMGSCSGRWKLHH